MTQQNEVTPETLSVFHPSFTLDQDKTLKTIQGSKESVAGMKKLIVIGRRKVHVIIVTFFG